MVVVEGLFKSFGTNLVLRGLSLEVKEAEILAVMGSSGGGKTTLLRCIAGLLVPDKGQVLVDGIDVERETEKARKLMGMVFQMSALFDYMSVEDNILFAVNRRSKLSHEDRKELLHDVLRMVGLEGSEKLMPAELSGGMRKRVGLARALALKPKVMLYDEPTTGLDPVTSYTIDALIADARKDMGITSILVSHDVSSVFRVADRIAFLHEGELIYMGDRAGFEASKEAPIQELLGKARATSLQ